MICQVNSYWFYLLNIHHPYLILVAGYDTTVEGIFYVFSMPPHIYFVGCLFIYCWVQLCMEIEILVGEAGIAKQHRRQVKPPPQPPTPPVTTEKKKL